MIAVGRTAMTVECPCGWRATYQPGTDAHAFAERAVSHRCLGGVRAFAALMARANRRAGERLVLGQTTPAVDLYALRRQVVAEMGPRS